MIGAFVLFMASQTQLPPADGYKWPLIGCVGICSGLVLYLLYYKAARWRETVAMETQQLPRVWPPTQAKSYYMDG